MGYSDDGLHETIVYCNARLFSDPQYQYGKILSYFHSIVVVSFALCFCASLSWCTRNESRNQLMSEICNLEALTPAMWALVLTRGLLDIDDRKQP